MKKLLLSAFAAVLALNAGAQSFRLSYTEDEMNAVSGTGYTPIANGQTIFIRDMVEEDPGFVYKLGCYLKLENLTSAPLNVTLAGTVNEEMTNNEFGEVTFCTPKGCEATYPATVNGTLSARESWQGPGFHLVYEITDPNWEEFDIEDEAYWGSFTCRLEIKGGGETFACNIVFNHNDDSFDVEVVDGDVNGDGEVDATDIAMVVDYMLGVSNPSFSSEAADMDGDGSVDAADISRIIAAILGR